MTERQLSMGVKLNSSNVNRIISEEVRRTTLLPLMQPLAISEKVHMTARTRYSKVIKKLTEGDV